MKYIYKCCDKIGIVFYVVFLYKTWMLCQYGAVSRDLPVWLFSLFGILFSALLWLVSRAKVKKDSSIKKTKKEIFRTEILFILVMTVMFGWNIIYSAVPYNGALSWKIDELKRKRTVEFVNDNFFKNGVEGILHDIDKKLNLPEELYVVNKFQVTFNKEGKVQTIETFLYGKDKNDKEKSYLVTYDRKKDEKITVYLDGRTKAEYDEDMRLDPMLRILENPLCRQQVHFWVEEDASPIYGIVYYGRRSFADSLGLVYVPGDVDGDGKISGVQDFTQLFDGGEIVGFEASLYVPGNEEIIPYRYIMEPEYVSQNVLNKEHEEVQSEAAKDVESWTVDDTDGTMYFFLNDQKGWRLVVTDAALGSRFYILERTVDGGKTWKRVSADPFAGEIGVAEGLQFYDENFGVAGLTGASQSHSVLYVTRDGGKTFSPLQMPMDTVTELPELAKELGFTIENYAYYEMPVKEDERLTIRVLTEAADREGIVFESRDKGETWEYVGIRGK